MIRFDETLSQQKDVLLNYFRDSATASLAEVSQKFGVNQFKERASAINKEIKETGDLLSQTLLQEAKNRQWDKRQMLDSVLMLNHVRNVVMLETRNDVWRYDYMAFSRRIGEIWEPFCKLCFDYPINDIQLFIPPLFSQVKEKLHNEIDEYIDGLKLSESQKQDLKQYYEKVWSMVASGEIKLQLDLHFKVGGGKKSTLILRAVSAQMKKETQIGY